MKKLRVKSTQNHEIESKGGSRDSEI